MECFYHQGTSAVGSCRSCFRGLCRNCAVELEGGLACPERCEGAVAAVVETLQQSARYQNVTSGLLGSAPGLWMGITVVSVFVGLFVVIWGLRLPAFQEIALLGLPFFGLGWIAFRTSQRIRNS